MAEDGRASIAAGILAAEDEHRELLRSIVEVARGIFDAKASSVMLHDPEADELVFEAVVGEGEETLIGKRIPADTGIAGFVLSSQQPLVVEDVQSDPRFARDVAEGSGYVPKGLMAVPLIRAEEAIGVLSVLDRPAQARFSLAEMDLLALFGSQAALALDLLRRSRVARAELEKSEADTGPLGAIADRLDGLAVERRRAALDLLAALDRVLAEGEGPEAIRLR